MRARDETMALTDPATIAVLASSLVALVALVMALLAWRAYRYTGNARLRFVVVAFALFAAKSAFTAYDVSTPLPHPIQHDHLEAILSVVDLAIILVLFVPFVLPKKG